MAAKPPPAAHADADLPPPRALLQDLGIVTAAGAPEQRYELYDELGHGGVARVVIGYDRSLQRQVAIKILHRRLSLDRSAVAAFLAEAQITAKLEHPGVVPIHDLGVFASGEVFFAMEKVEGRTLRVVLDEAGPERPTGKVREELLRVFEQVCHIVAFAHSRGVVHRDLKPENIMVGAFRDVYVVDWGIARDVKPPSLGDTALESPTKTSTLKGTPRYMAPEQTLGMDQQVDQRADVFALGLIGYEILAGQHPFAHDDIRATLHAICHDEPPPLKLGGLAPEVRSILKKAMRKVPSERYPSAQELAADVSAGLTHQAVAAHRSTVMGQAVNLVLRHPTTSALALSVVIAVGFLLAVLQVRQQQVQRLLDQSTAAYTQAQADSNRLADLQQQARFTAAADRPRQQALQSWLLARQQGEQAAGAALLEAAWHEDPTALPAAEVNHLRTIYLDRMQALLNTDRPAAVQANADLDDLISRRAADLTWPPEDRQRLQALRGALSAGDRKGQ